MLPKRLLIISGAILALSVGIEIFLENEIDSKYPFFNEQAEERINLTAFEKLARFHHPEITGYHTIDYELRDE